MNKFTYPECATKSPTSEQIRQGIKRARIERGVVWGSAGRARAKKNASTAQEFAETIRPVLLSLPLGDLRTHTRTARALNAAGVTAFDGGLWHRTTVKRLIERLPNFEAEIALRRAKAAQEYRLGKESATIISHT